MASDKSRLDDTDVIDISHVRLNSIVVDAPSSRASSFYEEGDNNVTACSFQSIWSRFADSNLAAEKAQAAELIEKGQLASYNSSSSKFHNCICGSARSRPQPLRAGVLADEQVLIVALSKVNFSDSNPLHWELLCSFYKHIIETGKKAVPRYGSHWENVGFQGTDPATDLRGVGVFGLCQLLFLVSNGLSSQMTTQLIELSRDKVQNFPFAIVGLNFTQYILERLKQGKLNSLATKDNSCISVVNGIYRGCFIVFYRMWKTRGCTILEFSTISNEIKSLIKRRPKYLLNMAVLQG
uniref:ELMO domain-containing protein n=1 Tax=Panagrellus redivivus TaxID=6233 RepID=A0A7E4WAD9_PANRE